MKKIANIVFYRFVDENKENRIQTAIYYNDGTVYSCTDKEGLEIAKEYLEEKNGVPPTNEEIQNAENIHFISGDQFEETFSEYIVNETNTALIPTNEKSTALIPVKEKTSDMTQETYKNYKRAIELCEERVSLLEELEKYDENYNKESIEELEDRLTDNKKELAKTLELLPEYIKNDIIEQYPELIKKQPKIDEKHNDSSDSKSTTNTKKNSKKEEKKSKRNKKNKKKKRFFGRRKNKKESSKDTLILEPQKQEKESKKEKTSFISKIANKFRKKNKKSNKKNNKNEKTLKDRFILIVIAVAMAFGGIGYGIGKTIESKTNNANLKNKTEIERMAESGRDVTGDEALTFNNNSYYNEYTYNELLKVNTVNSQKTTMKNVGKTLDGYNGMFANKFQEIDKDGNIIKPALTWDETIALNMAYNEHSKGDIKAIFNGATINSSDFSNAYRMANLQLIGAHIIETKEHPVDMSYLINSEEGKEFYNEYHQKYLELKTLKGKDLEIKVKEFRADIKEDFPITDDIREVGLSHSEPREIESYKLSVVPMIGAFEMEYRNVAVEEETLNNKEIDYLNDTALCNIADEKFEQIQTITLTTEEDKTQPTYEQYKNAKIKELEDKNNYNIGDEERDPSKLSVFQDRINSHFELKDGHFTGTIYYDDGSVYTKSKTTYRTETTREEAEMPQSEKDKIDQEIEKENDKAKEEAQKDADKKQEELQDEADKETEENIKEVEKDDKDMQDKIDDANDKIENDQPVNEDDFGDHDVDFDDEYSDEKGNLDDSVEDLTTDSTGDVTNEPLPDPEETGKDFDGKVITQTKQGGTGNTTDQNIFEYEVEVTPNKTKEQIANEIVEEMANNPVTVEEKPKQLVK